jgi:YebC/PmpR family DNA-binding regulatory protein
MPKDTIERAITRGEGKNASEMFDVVYEGFGPGGFSVIVEAITDNKQRTTPEIKSIFDKAGGTLGVPGSVNYQFAQKGQIVVGKNGKTLDEIFLIAADFGADDVEEEEEDVLVYTSPEELSKVRSSLEENGLSVKSAELLYKPIVIKDVADPNEAEKAVSFMEKLEDHGDVQKVYANFAIS